MSSQYSTNRKEIYSKEQIERKMITLIYDIHNDGDKVTVKAVVEDSVLVYPATNIDPPEYGPALCEASFYLEENEILPKDDDQLIDYLEELNLDWEVIPEENY